jgi:hypothetical protein
LVGVYYGCGVWVRSAAIRPVPPYALLSEKVLEEVEQFLGEEDERTDRKLQDAFERFERQQPALAVRMAHHLERTQDEVAVALGTFLGISLWLAFEESFRDTLTSLSETEVEAVAESLQLDEQLRGRDPAEAIDSEDVVAMEQPHAVEFLQEHVDAALEVHADSVDVDAVHGIYRMLLVTLLSLSYAVRPPERFTGESTEIEA